MAANMCNPSLSTAVWEAETHKQREAQEDSLLGIQRGSGQEALFLEHSPLKDPVPSRNRLVFLLGRGSGKQQQLNVQSICFSFPCSWAEVLGRK